MDDGETSSAKPSNPASGALSIETRQATNRSGITHIVSDSFVTLWTVARQTPLSMGFPRQEYWSRLPPLSPGDLTDLGIEPRYLVFPVVMYGCESWTVKKAECQRIDAFELWCWRRLLTVPWTARRSNQSILKKISPGCSLEGLMLKLKLQYFGHLMRKVDSLEKTLMLGGIGGRRRSG